MPCSSVVGIIEYVPVFHTSSITYVRGVFAYIATWRVKGDHYVDLSFREGVVEPKIQPKAQSLAQGLAGHFPRMFKS